MEDGIDGDSRTADISRGILRPLVARTELLHDIDRELSELTRVLGAVRSFGAADSKLIPLEQRTGDLAALRNQVEATNSPALLAQLKTAIAENIRNASDTLTTAQNAVASSAGTMSRQMADATYHAKILASENVMRDIIRQDARGFIEADTFARQHGIDGTPYAGARVGLQDVADRYRKKGDRVGGLVTDALITENTADYWEKLANDTGNPEAQRKAAEATRLAERAEREAHDAVRAQVEKETADRGMAFESEPARDAWLEGETKRRHQAKKEEAIDAAVASGKMTVERGEELKKDAVSKAQLNGLQTDSEATRSSGLTSSIASGSLENDEGAEAQRKLAANSQFILAIDDARVGAGYV